MTDDSYYTIPSLHETQVKQRGKFLWWAKLRGQDMVTSPWFMGLTLSERGMWLSLLCVALITKNRIPTDPKMIQRLAQSTQLIDITIFTRLGLVVSGGGVETMSRQGQDHVETVSSLEKSREEVENREEIDSHPTDDPRLRRDELANRVIELWNETASVNDLPIVRTPISTQRRTHLRKRLDVASWFDDYVLALAEIPQSSFLTGGSGWRANIDFMLRPETVTKILEGKYRDATPRATVAPPAPAGPYANRPRPSWINEQGDNWLMSDDAERDSAAFFAEHGTISFQYWSQINGHPYP